MLKNEKAHQQQENPKFLWVPQYNFFTCHGVLLEKSKSRGRGTPTKEVRALKSFCWASFDSSCGYSSCASFDAKICLLAWKHGVLLARAAPVLGVTLAISDSDTCTPSLDECDGSMLRIDARVKARSSDYWPASHFRGSLDLFS